MVYHLSVFNVCDHRRLRKIQLAISYTLAASSSAAVQECFWRLLCARGEIRVPYQHQPTHGLAMNACGTRTAAVVCSAGLPSMEYENVKIQLKSMQFINQPHQ